MNRRTRVLRIITRLNVGGPALHAAVLTERLDPSRFASLLVAGQEGRDEGNYLALHGKRLRGLVTMLALRPEIHARDTVALAQLVRLIRRVRPDIVHTHTAKAGAVGRLAAWLCRVPLIVHTYHGHVLRGYFSTTRTRLYATLERWLARRTRCLIAVSPRVRDEVLAFGIGTPDQFRIVPLGLDLDPFLTVERRRGRLRAELGVPSDAVLIGIVARLVPIKGHEVFLEAAARVAGTVPGSVFVVVGDGERREELISLGSARGLRNRLHFLGWRRDLADIYADLDVVALSSWNEGSPVALIEAMAAGCPTVATRVGGVPDVVEEGVTGELVAPGDAAELATAIAALIQDPERCAALGRAGRTRAVRAFHQDRLVADVEALYGTLLAGVEQRRLDPPVRVTEEGHRGRAARTGPPAV